MDIKTAVNQLSEIIRNSHDYLTLKSLYNEVMSDPSYKNMLDNLAAKQRKLYDGSIQPQDSEKYLSDLNKDYENLRRTPQLRAYFEASERFNELMASVHRTVDEGIY